jgi:hypothetical protein
MPDPDSRGSSCAPPVPYTRPIPAPIESSHRYYPPHALLPGEMETGEILRAQLGIPLGVPVNLNALLDPPPGDKPPEPLPTLMKLAIYGSPSKQLTLQEIYTALEERYEYFRNRTHDTAWKVHVPLPGKARSEQLIERAIELDPTCSFTPQSFPARPTPHYRAGQR